MLKEQLLDDSVPARALVPIAGESSIGKTTLARKVYQSLEVRNHFEIRTWTVLPHKCHATDVLRDIHRQMTNQLRWAPSVSNQATEYSCDGDKAFGTGCGRAPRWTRSAWCVYADGGGGARPPACLA